MQSKIKYAFPALSMLIDQHITQEHTVSFPLLRPVSYQRFYFQSVLYRQNQHLLLWCLLFPYKKKPIFPSHFWCFPCHHLFFQETNQVQTVWFLTHNAQIPLKSTVYAAALKDASSLRNSHIPLQPYTFCFAYLPPAQQKGHGSYPELF